RQIASACLTNSAFVGAKALLSPLAPPQPPTIDANNAAMANVDPVFIWGYNGVAQALKPYSRASLATSVNGPGELFPSSVLGSALASSSASLIPSTIDLTSALPLVGLGRRSNSSTSAWIAGRPAAVTMASSPDLPEFAFGCFLR